MSSNGFYTLSEFAARNEYMDALSAEIVDAHEDVTPEHLYEQQFRSGDTQPRYTLDECRGYYSIMYESGFE